MKARIVRIGNSQGIRIPKPLPEELSELRNWFVEFDSDAWDEDIEADPAAGKLDALAAEALAEYETGKAKEIGTTECS